MVMTGLYMVTTSPHIEETCLYMNEIFDFRSTHVREKIDFKTDIWFQSIFTSLYTVMPGLYMNEIFDIW